LAHPMVVPHEMYQRVFKYLCWLYERWIG